MLVTDVVGDDVLPPALGQFSEELVVVLALLVGLIAAAVLIYRWVFATPGKRFARLIGSFDSVAILMHPNPDPDAMSCALAAQSIAEHVDTEATIYYSGQIRHHENRAFETVLDATFERIESSEEITEDRVVLVDHNEARGFESARRIDPVAVVDHHPGDGTGSKFTDVRPENGACATIFAEYFRQLGYTPRDPNDGHDETRAIEPRITTALLYGIQSDTKHLTTGCTAEEFEAASFLYPGIDEDKLDRIANPVIDVESIDVKARAISDRDVRGVFAISDVGGISNVDAIPQAADELRRLEGINAVVVLGDKNGTIQLSGRSTDDRVHMGKVIETAVEVFRMAEGGGHSRMGGGQVPVDHMKGLGPDDGLTREELKQRLFDAMNGEL